MAALEALLAESSDGRSHPKGKTGRGLRVEVPEQCPLAGGGREIAQVRRGGRLPDATLHVVNRDHLHGAPSMRPARLKTRRQADWMSCAQNRDRPATTGFRRRSWRVRLCSASLASAKTAPA